MGVNPFSDEGAPTDEQNSYKTGIIVLRLCIKSYQTTPLSMSSMMS